MLFVRGDAGRHLCGVEVVEGCKEIPLVEIRPILHQTLSWLGGRWRLKRQSKPLSVILLYRSFTSRIINN